MSSEKVPPTDGSEGFSRGLSRRRVLSIVPATLFARWLTTGARGRGGPGSPGVPSHCGSGVPRDATKAYRHDCGETRVETYSFENAGATVVVRDAHGRVVAAQSLSTEWVRDYRYHEC